MEEKKTFSMDEFRSFIGKLIEKGGSIDRTYLQNSLTERIDCHFIKRIQHQQLLHLNDDLLSLSCAIFLPHNNSPIHAVTGYQDPMGSSEEININTTFNIGSISKFIIMNLVMLLIKNGLLALDQPIARFTCTSQVDLNQQITIRHLLGHYSGLKDKGFIEFGENDPLDKILNTIRAGKPGEKFYYSNINFVILGLIIKQVTGQSLEECLRKYILEPLKLNNTSVIQKDVKNYAKGYKYDIHSNSLIMASDFYIWGATNIRTTPTDLVILIKNFFENDWYMPLQLRSEVIISCHEVNFEVATKETVYKWPATFGLGIERHALNKLTKSETYTGLYCYGHGGWQNSNVAFLAYCPHTKAAYCLAGSKTQGLEKQFALLNANSLLKDLSSDQPTTPQAEAINVNNQLLTPGI